MQINAYFVFLLVLQSTHLKKNIYYDLKAKLAKIKICVC